MVVIALTTLATLGLVPRTVPIVVVVTGVVVVPVPTLVSVPPFLPIFPALRPVLARFVAEVPIVRALLGEVSGSFAVEASLALSVLPAGFDGEVHAHAFSKEFVLVELLDGGGCSIA